MFSFTPNTLVHSGLCGVGEAVKAINENLLTCGMCGRTRTRVLRERALDRAFIGEGGGKVGRTEKESGGVSEEGGGMKGGKEMNGNMKVGQMMKKGKHESEKPSRSAKRGVRRK